MSKKKKLKLVMITWLDSCTTDTNWKNVNSEKGVAKCVSVGFLVTKTKKYVTLFPNIHQTNIILGCNDFTIPVGAIVKMKTLKQ